MFYSIDASLSIERGRRFPSIKIARLLIEFMINFSLETFSVYFFCQCLPKQRQKLVSERTVLF